MEYFSTTCTILGTFILSFGLVSLFIKERLYISETVVATVYGIVCGPNVSGWISQDFLSVLQDKQLIFHFSHIVISLQLVAVGVTVPRVFLRKNWRDLATLLLPAMLMMWLVSTLVVKGVLGMGWKESMIIGTCVTPTDPVLASAVVKGKFANKYIPWKLRHLLAVESGANDGLGFPLLTLPLFLLVEASPKEAVKKWLLKTWVFEILIAIVIGLVIGIAARLLLKYSLKRFLIDKESFLAYILSLAILVTGLTAAIHSDDLLAVFISGVAFAWDEEMVKDLKESHVLEVVDLLFNHVFFILFGLIVPWSNFKLSHFIAAILIVTFRRLPATILLKQLGLLKSLSNKEVAFAGWFGPIGVGAIFFAYHTDHFLTHTPYEHLSKDVITAVYAVVLVSIFIHGPTAPIIHLHLRRRERKRGKKETLYCSDTEAEKDLAIAETYN